MKPRARRVTLAAAALGVGVLAVLVVGQWERVRHHCEECWLRLTGNVVISPAPDRIGENVDIEAGEIEVGEIVRFIANSTGRAIVLTAAQSENLRNTITIVTRMNDVSAEMGLAILRAHRIDLMACYWLREAYALTTSRPLCVEPTEDTLVIPSP